MRCSRKSGTQPNRYETASSRGRMLCEVNLLVFMSLQGKRTLGSDCTTFHLHSNSAVLIYVLRSARSPWRVIQPFLCCISEKLSNQDSILSFYSYDSVNQSAKIRNCLEPQKKKKKKSRRGPLIATVVCKS